MICDLVEEETLSKLQRVEFVLSNVLLSEHITLIIQNLDTCYEVSKARLRRKLVDDPSDEARLGNEGPKLATDEKAIPFVTLDGLSLAFSIERHNIHASWERDLHPNVSLRDNVIAAEGGTDDVYL